jgi:photosystem II stability/assembly factor-like uncharacterized protein
MAKRYLMPIMIVVFLAFSVSASLAGSWNGWIYQNPYPTSNNLLAVKFVTPEKGWIAGQYGTILYTEDGGETWQYQESGTEQDLKSISFVNEKVGWAVGNGGVIIYTEDGGKKWQKQGNFTVSLHKGFPINEKESWVGGVAGTLLHTNDGGKTWRKQDIGTWYDIAGIFFKDINTGWVLSGGKVYRTKDGGKNWEVSQLPIKAPQGGFSGVPFRFTKPSEEYGWGDADIFFSNDKLGWVVLHEQVYKTKDGGKIWEVNDLKGYDLGRIVFADEKNGCVGGTSILCTEDGGKTWNERLGIKPGERDVIEGFMVAIWGLSFADQSTGWAVGADGAIFKTEDGGKSWKVKSRGSGYIYEFFFLDANTGWAVTYDLRRDKGSIVRTDNGGSAWKVQKEFETRVILRYFFINAITGWAVGHETVHDHYKGPLVLNYFILHTKDGGKTWESQFKAPGRELEVSDNLEDVFFINPDTGWAVGSNGLILHTKDGGRHWERQKSGTKSNLWKIQFIDDKRGWVIGNKVSEGRGTSIILHTDDGGEHWHVQWKKKTDWMWLHELRFIDENNGWVTGNITEDSGDCIFLQTTDGGKTWAEKEFKEIYFDQMFFLDKNIGTILTEKNHILITRDGGKTWERQLKPLRRYPWHISEIFKEKGK